jgi:protein-S-isoprenylcysteine O-methyltransferase Ste14
MGQPFWTAGGQDWTGVRFIPLLLHPVAFPLGIVLVVAGYAGTLWCYAAMGNLWRIGIDRQEKNSLVTRGPYRAVRHPIYLFQIVMLAGALFLLPTALSLMILIIHFFCALVKAFDEESYLVTVHGQEYRDYLSRTGGLFPKLWRGTSRVK